MSINNIVVGVDFSPSSDVAATSAANLARRHRARLHLVYAGAVPDISPHGRETYFSEAVRAMNNAEFKHAREQLTALSHRLAGDELEIVTAVIDGPPAAAIEKAAKELKADLVVVGSHGRTGAERLFLGSVAERILRIAPCSVLVARTPFLQTGARRVLVPIDFTDATDATLAVLPSMVAEEAEVELFHVWGPLDATMYASAWVLTGGIENLRKQLGDGADKQAARHLAELEAHGVRARFFNEEGHAREKILQRLEHQPYDLVVMGSHPRGRLPRWLLGSVAERVIRHTAISALVVRTPS